MNRCVWIACAGVVSLGLLGGCGSKDKSAQAQASEPPTEFEQAKIPEFTAETRFAAGQLAESQNLPQRAIDQYAEAIALDPRHREAIYRLAIIYTQQQMFPQAVETWRKYIDATDGSAAAWSNLALCHELAGEHAQAEVAYKKGIEKEPSNQVCRVNYGLMLARQRKYPEAAEQMGTVLSQAEVHYNIASVLEQQGRTEQAKKVYLRALELDPNYNNARSRLAALE
jgi:tetratricopeptide (TPR) repeat protein